MNVARPPGSLTSFPDVLGISSRGLWMQTRQLKTRVLLVSVWVPATNSGRLNPPKVDG